MAGAIDLWENAAEHMGQRSPDDLQGDLQRWVDAGLIGPDQRAAILAHEAAAPAAHPERRVSVVAEALGYAGAALALAGILSAIGNAWGSLSPVGRIVVVAAPTVLAVAAGWVLRPKTEPALRRLMSLLWFLATGGFAGTAGTVIDYVDLRRSWILLAVGLSVAVPAVLLWAMHRAALQQIALLIGILLTMLGGLVALPGEANGLYLAVASTALGVVWLLLGRRGALPPAPVTEVLGALLAALAPAFAAPDHEWLLFLGVALGAGLMALSVGSSATPLLVIGTVTVFGYVTSIVVRYFGDQLGVPLALTIIGGIFIALALVAARLGRFGRAAG